MTKVFVLLADNEAVGVTTMKTSAESWLHVPGSDYVPFVLDTGTKTGATPFSPIETLLNRFKQENFNKEDAISALVNLGYAEKDAIAATQDYKTPVTPKETPVTKPYDMSKLLKNVERLDAGLTEADKTLKDQIQNLKKRLHLKSKLLMRSYGEDRFLRKNI
jgi:hypothetical protein